MHTSVDEALVRQFLSIAANERDPRAFRFLRSLLVASGQPIKRNQELVLECLGEFSARTLVFYTDAQGRLRRDNMLVCSCTPGARRPSHALTRI